MKNRIPTITSLPMRQEHQRLQEQILSIGTGSLDMLHVECQTLRKNLLKRFDPIDDFKSLHYKEGIRLVCPITGISFSALKEPKIPSMIYKYQIQINPSKFSGYKSFFSFLKEILDEDSIENHLLHRVDPAVCFNPDIYLVEWLYYLTHFKWKRRSGEYPINRQNRERGRLTTFDIGRTPFRLNCYLDQKNPEKIRTKIELQIRRHPRTERYIPNRVQDLGLLLKTNPFSQIRFRHVYDKPKNLKPQAKIRFARLREEVFRRGLQGAKPILNTNNNFNRDYEKLLSPVAVSKFRIPFERLLKASFHRGLEDWLNN